MKTLIINLLIYLTFIFFINWQLIISAYLTNLSHKLLFLDSYFFFIEINYFEIKEISVLIFHKFRVFYFKRERKDPYCERNTSDDFWEWSTDSFKLLWTLGFEYQMKYSGGQVNININWTSSYNGTQLQGKFNAQFVWFDVRTKSLSAMMYD